MTPNEAMNKLQAIINNAGDDISFGVAQQTARWADEGNQTNSLENIKLIRQLYFDPTHAINVACTKLKYWKYNPDVSDLTALCAYNMPTSYHNPESNPNITNYRDGLSRAAVMLQVSSEPVQNRVYGPDVPDSVILQKNDWSCAVRSLYAALWTMTNVEQTKAVTYGDNGPRDVYNLLVPKYDDPSVGLHAANGAGLVEALAMWNITAQAQTDVPLSSVQALAGTKPLLLGGESWNHWVYCRGVEADGTLMLANPSPNFGGINNELRDSWNRLGPFTLVEIDIPTRVPNENFVYVFGISDKAKELGLDTVGEPIENEHGIDDRFSIQRSSKGLFVYSKEANLVSFIPG